MAETEKDKAWVNVLIEKDLLKEFDQVVTDLDTDRSKLIRQLIREAVEDHKRARRVKQSVQSRAIVRRSQVQ